MKLNNNNKIYLTEEEEQEMQEEMSVFDDLETDESALLDEFDD